MIQKAASYDGSSWEGDCTNALGFLARLYVMGTGVQKDETKAFLYFEKAANRGNIYAMRDLAGCYFFGLGVGKDLKKYFEWMQKAASTGYPEALNDLAYCYMEGRGVSINKEKAWECLNKALEAEPENPNFIDSKGEFYAIEGKVESALAVWEQLNKIDSTFIAKCGETNFSRYIKGLEDDNVDFNIPHTTIVNDKTFAVVIANENYQEHMNVPYAINDGTVFVDYCENVFGIPRSNIHFVKDATLNNIRRELRWLQGVLSAYKGEAQVIFYYAGHGIPDEKGTSSYILPIDGNGSDVATGYKLEELYSTLSSQPANRVIVFLDACFSGSNRDGQMLNSARGVAIKAKTATPMGNMVVLSAAQGGETAWPYTEQQHGLFTYYLLKKFKETKGDVVLSELGDYVCAEVKKQSIVTNKKSQSPVINASVVLGDSWKGWKLR